MKKILVIDDDVAFVGSMKASLDKARYTVASAKDGVEGLKQMEEFRPDLILLDIAMPAMDGIEFLKQVNKKYGEGKTPVLVTSNVSSLEKISEGVSLGIRAYFMKSNESLKGISGIIDKVFE
ncbi:MAG: response regulator [bacterium]|nr:response regulator [bacterium]